MVRVWGRRGGGEGDEESDPGHILQVQPTRYTQGFDVASERKRGVRDNAMVFGCSSVNGGVAEMAGLYEEPFGVGS